MKMGKKHSKLIKTERIRNKKLIKQYPWLKPVNVWTGKIPKDYDYSYIEWYGWPNGWNVAFGDMYLQELGAEIKQSGQKDFQILQMKEKYGRCINYVSGTTEKAHQIINKYETLSENICWNCGKPDVPMIDDGWVHPICLKCFIKAEHNRDKYHKELHPEYVPKTNEELTELYQNCIIDKPNENGEYRMADSYTIRRFGDHTDTTYDISETSQAIRKRWERRVKNYEKRISRSRRAT